MILVIVESPAKCKKIESYLGVGYKCIASYGHIREMDGLKSIDIGNTFQPTYRSMLSKKKYINSLRTNIQKANEVILATDDDREGEAIAWHICMLFNLSIQRTKRIIFHEITKPAIKKALNNPTHLNINKIYSQQSRQVLDLLVGFKVSPVLWKNISGKSGLSAGRCQTSALRLVYDNYKEISNKTGKCVYNTVADFNLINTSLPFELNKQFKSADNVNKFLEKSRSFKHELLDKNEKKVFKQPPNPLTTSKLQQKASNDLGFSPKVTMSCAQRLYENGYITYMRTDSLKYSNEFIKSAKNHIHDKYGEKYILKNIFSLANKSHANDAKQADSSKNKKPTKNTKNTKNDLAQEAHEAIRPTSVERTSLPINGKITNKELRLYLLIYKNALASCMSPAIYDKLTISIVAPIKTKYTYITEQVVFEGWCAVYGIETRNENYEMLKQLDMSSSNEIKYEKISSNMKMVDLKPHYTESKLIQLLETKGIGRPSTYSSIISRIQDKKYVNKEDVPGVKIKCSNYVLEGGNISKKIEENEFGSEKGKLVLQSTGLFVIEFLIKHFNELFEYDYTRNMETELDKIANGDMTLLELCKTCNNTIDTSIKNIKKQDKPIVKIDKYHTYTIGKYGPVIKHTDDDGVISFKQINKNIKIDLNKLKNGEYKLSELIGMDNHQNNNRELGEHNGSEVVLKNGKFGMYVTIDGKNTSVKYINKDMDDITLEDVVEYINKKGKQESNIIKRLNDDMSIRKGRYGPYVYYKTNSMNRPKFISMKGVAEEEITVSWIEARLND
jgi:DNA topoisomerase-1